MTRWLRHLRIALGAFAIVFAVAVYFAIRERAPAPPSATLTRSDPAAVAETTGGATTMARGTRRDFQVQYARALTYADGSVRLEQLNVAIPQRAGRDFAIKAQKGTVQGDQSSVTVEGDVVLTATDGLEARTATASYSTATGLLTAPGDVAFSRRRMTGRSIGATYDRDRDVLTLLDKVRIDVRPDGEGLGQASITAGAASFAHRERYIRFERSMRLERAGQVIEAESAVAFLAPLEDRLELIELRGQARVTGTEARPGGLRDMHAREMNLAYAEDGETLRRSTLTGDAAIVLSAAGGQTGRRLAGSFIDLEMAPDGSTPVRILARETVQLDLPAEGSVPGRRIRSAALDAWGPPDRGLTTSRFTGAVEFRETRPATKGAPASERVARSATLEAAIKEGFGAFDAAQFGGGTSFRDGALQATSIDATYNVARGTLLLVSPGGAGKSGARVDDERATVEARRIDVALDGRRLAAEGDVRSVLKGAPAPGPGGQTGHGAGGRRPAVLKGDQPVNVAANRLTYDPESGSAVYEGEAKLWQGETSVQASRIVLDEAKGNLQADGKVRSTLRLNSKDATTGETQAQTTLISAEQLRYEDAKRCATYTTSARMSGPDGDLRARQLELFLTEKADALERAEAYDEVSLRSGLRSSLGTRMTYFALEGRYVMSGSPVRIYEQMPEECRETIGRTLTFYRSTDSISVDGNEESRTRTTSGGKCPGVPVG